MAEALASQDSSYVFKFEDGRPIKRLQLAKLILDTIGEDKKHTAQIANEIGMSYQSVFAVIRTLVTGDLLISEKMSKNTAYKKPKRCGLTSYFNHAKVIENLKVNSSKKYKAEDFPNVSFGGKSGYENYSSNYSNTIYEGGE
tara:strand:+ start:175 stop:600 length:426 start_codon:yes stop_codon:yes gene_type:complete